MHRIGQQQSGFLERVAWFVVRAASLWGVFYRKSI